MNRLLVTGGAGYLGAYLLANACAALPDWEIHGAYFSQPLAAEHGRGWPLDLTSAEAVQRLLDCLRPTAIIHTACSNRTGTHVRAIVPAATHLAAAARQYGIRLVHVSTDIVFDGEHAPYDDDARPSPILDYGRAKAEAEAVVAELCPTAAIVRPSLIWSLQPKDRQLAWLVEAIRRGERVTLFTDEIRCPVHLADLSDTLFELAQRPDIAGPINLGGPQPLSRWEFGKRLLEALGLPLGGTVLPGTILESGIVRARDLTLRSARAQQLATRLRGMDEALAGLPARDRRPRYCEG